MRALTLLLAGLLLGLVPGAPARSQDGGEAKKKEEVEERVLAIRAAKVYTVAGPVIPNGVVLVQGGKILGVGPTVPIPPGAELLDAGPGTVIPGLVECHGSAGLVAGEGRGSGADDADILDGWDPYSIDPARVLRQGVTSVFLLLRGGSGGKTAVVQPGATPGPPEVLLHGGALRMIASSSRTGGNPMTWVKAGDALKSRLEAAQKYKEAREKYLKELAAFEAAIAALKAKKTTGTPGTTPSPRPPMPRPPTGLPPGMRPPSRGPSRGGAPVRPREVAENEAMERWVQVLERTLPLRIVANRASELKAICKIAKEFRVRVVLEGAAEADQAVAEITEARAMVLLHMEERSGWVDKEWAYARPGLTAALAAGKVPFALTLGRGDARSTRLLRLAATLAMADGCPEDAALRGVTMYAAAACGLPRGSGSLVRGARADLVVLSGAPLDARSKVTAVIAGGKRVR